MFEAQKEKIGNVTHFVMRKINQVVKKKTRISHFKNNGSYKSRKENISRIIKGSYMPKLTI